MTSPNALGALASLAEIAFVGRVLLALLPPGLPGRHGLRDLPATWGASHLLGTVALGLEMRLADLAGITPPHAALLTPWFLLALARWVTLPGAMVPRDEPLSEVPSPVSRALGALAPLIVLASALAGNTEFDPSRAVSLANALALLALCAFGLSAARRTPLGRALAVLALALILAAAFFTSATTPIPLTALMGSGAAFAVVWLRRGDRRAAALSVIALAGCAALGPREALFGAAGLFGLWLHTPAPSRPSLGLFAAAVLATCAALGFATNDPGSSPELPSMRTTAALSLVAALALGARKRFHDARNREPRAFPPAAGTGFVDSSRPEAEAVRDVVLLCLFPLTSRGDLSSLFTHSSALLPLAPMIAIECALAFAPSERPLAAPELPGALAQQAGTGRERAEAGSEGNRGHSRR